MASVSVFELSATPRSPYSPRQRVKASMAQKRPLGALDTLSDLHFCCDSHTRHPRFDRHTRQGGGEYGELRLSLNFAHIPKEVRP